MSFSVASNGNLQLRIIDSKLRQEAVLADPLTGFVGVYNEATKTLPDAAMVKVAAKNGEYTHTISTILALVGSGVAGRQQVVGTEEELQTREITLKANTFGNAVPTLQWGIDADLNKSINILTQVQPKLSQWHKEVTGWKVREALTRLYSSEQTLAPANRTQGLNPNFIMSSATGASRVTFPGTNVSDFATNIGKKLFNTPANGGQDGSAAAAGSLISAQFGGLDSLASMQEIADLFLVLESFSEGSEETLALSVPTPIFTKLYQAASTANSYANLVKFDKVDAALTITGFRYGKLVIMNDPRFPVVNVTPTGAAGNITSAALSWYYKTPGGADARFASKTAGTIDCYVGFLLGKGAFYEFESSPLQFRENSEDYGRNVGVGAFKVCGYSAGVFGKSTTTPDAGIVDGSGNYQAGIYNKASAVVLFPAIKY